MAECQIVSSLWGDDWLVNVVVGAMLLRETYLGLGVGVNDVENMRNR